MRCRQCSNEMTAQEEATYAGRCEDCWSGGWDGKIKAGEGRSAGRYCTVAELTRIATGVRGLRSGGDGQ